jgi:hypothetical protein
MLYNQWKYNRAKYSTADLEDGLAPITATSSVTCSGEQIKYVDVSIQFTANSSFSSDSTRVRESDAISAGASSVGIVYVRKRENSLIVAGISSTSATCNRVQSSSATVSVSSTTVVSPERIQQPTITISPVASVTITAEAVYLASGTTTSTATSTVLGLRVIDVVVAITSTSSVSSEAIEQWEIISEGSEVWTLIAA